MNFFIILKVALRSLRRTLLRSILTMLGIIIGVAAVIAMIGIGNGAKARVQNLVAGMDANRITLQARAPYTLGRPGNAPLPPGDGLTVEDYEAIRTRLPGLAAATVQVSGARVSSAAANGRQSTIQLTGCDLDGLTLANRTVLSGSAFGTTDVSQAASVCVITQSLATELFDRADPVGRSLRLAGQPFTILGLVSDDTSSRNFLPEGRDLAVFVPYTSLLRRLDRTARLTFILKAAEPSELPALQQALGDLLEERRGNRKAEFVANDLTEAIKNYTQSVDTMTLLLASIAGISLLVGGIGIMNIMLVSVTERTREIGIRLAIGTRGRDVLRQFVIEAVILSVLGGLIGIVLGVTAAKLVTRLNEWPTEITAGAILGAFLTSVAIGVFFGWYPARKASQLDPIEALRHE